MNLHSIKSLLNAFEKMKQSHPELNSKYDFREFEFKNKKILKHRIPCLYAMNIDKTDGIIIYECREEEQDEIEYMIYDYKTKIHLFTYF